MESPKITTKFGKGNPGKPKGAKNKTTMLAKEAIALAAEKLGGAERLVSWAKEDAANERVFWGQIYTKLLPLQLANSDGEAFKVEQIARKIIDPTHDC